MNIKIIFLYDDIKKIIYIINSRILKLKTKRVEFINL